MSKRKDIEYEMSRFEEEITKLSPAAVGVESSNYVLAGQSVGLKPRINIQIPSSFSMMTPTQPSFTPFSFQTPQIPLPSSPFLNSTSTPPFKPASIMSKIISDSLSTPTSGIKRDSSGNVLTPTSTTASTSSAALNNSSKSTPTTAAAAATAVAAAASEVDKKKAKDAKDKNKKKKFVRAAGGQVWEDDSLTDWDPDDFRLFCGDLGNEVNDESLARAFQKYASFQRAKVVRDKRTGKTRGYGFVSFKDSQDFIKAMREMNGKYVGNRPIKLRKSNWKDRNLEMVRKKNKKNKKWDSDK